MTCVHGGSWEQFGNSEEQKELIWLPCSLPALLIG